MSNLTELTEKATLEGDELIYVVDDPSGTPADRKAVLQMPVAKITTGSALEGQPLEADGAGGAQVSGVKEYVTLLTQDGGETAPSATVYKNLLSGAVVYSRTAAGSYVGTLVGAFLDGKVLFFYTSRIKNDDDVYLTIKIYRIDNDSFGIDCIDESTGDTVELQYSLGLQLRVEVYP